VTFPAGACSLVRSAGVIRDAWRRPIRLRGRRTEQTSQAAVRLKLPLSGFIRQAALEASARVEQKVSVVPWWHCRQEQHEEGGLMPPSSHRGNGPLEEALDPAQDLWLVDAIGVARAGAIGVDDERVHGQDGRPVEDGTARVAEAEATLVRLSLVAR
jgi:hypothetical protein